MKTITLAILSAVFLTGCFSAHKKHESYALAETYQDGKLASRFEWRDRSKGGGGAVMADPKASQIQSDNKNQSALGGGSTLNVGEISSTARPDAITATGGAVGEGARAFSGLPKVPLAPSPPSKSAVKIGDKIYTIRKEPDIYMDAERKLYLFHDDKMVPLPSGNE